MPGNFTLNGLLPYSVLCPAIERADSAHLPASLCYQNRFPYGEQMFGDAQKNLFWNILGGSWGVLSLDRIYFTEWVILWYYYYDVFTRSLSFFKFHRVLKIKILKTYRQNQK